MTDYEAAIVEQVGRLAPDDRRFVTDVVRVLADIELTDDEAAEWLRLTVSGRARRLRIRSLRWEGAVAAGSPAP